MSNRSGSHYSAPTDADRRPVLLGASTLDGITPVALEANPSTGALLVETTTSGGNDVNLAKVGGSPISIGQQLSAASLPVVLPATQITALTPPAAITNYALETGGNLASIKTDLDTLAGTVSSSKININISSGSIANTSFIATGTTAQGSSISANPLTIGGRGATTSITSVSDGQVVNAMFDKQGKQVAINNLRELLLDQQTTITSSVSETTIVTADATYYLDLYGLILTNTSATATNVTIKDATSGTTRMVIAVPAGDTRGFTVPADNGHKQATANNNWTATSSASIASLYVTAMVAKRL